MSRSTADGGGRAELAAPQSGAAEGGAKPSAPSIAPGEPPVLVRRLRARSPRSRDRTVGVVDTRRTRRPAGPASRTGSRRSPTASTASSFAPRWALATKRPPAAASNCGYPRPRLQPALRDLSRLGDVRSRSQSGEDVTSQIVSAADRLQAARAQRRGLLRRLEAADSDTEVEALSAQLDANAREISGLRASLRAQRARANYATVSVTLEADDGGSGLGSELGRGRPRRARSTTPSAPCRARSSWRCARSAWRSR